MRKVVLLALAASAVMVASVVASAEARTETQFSALSRIERVRAHVSTHGGRTKALVFLHGTLFAHHRRVGSETLKATGRHKGTHLRVRLRWVARFRGQGSIKAIGTLLNFTPRRFEFNLTRLQRLVIIGGTGAFNGAAGKLFFRDVGGGRQRLDFHFVQ